MKDLYKQQKKTEKKIKKHTEAIANMLAWKHKTEEDKQGIREKQQKVEQLKKSRLTLLNQLEDAVGVEIRKEKKSLNEIEVIHSEVINKLSA